MTIDIPSVLVHLRAKAVAAAAKPQERAAFRALSWIFGSRRRFAAAARLGRVGQWLLVREGRIMHLPPPLSGWTRSRDLRPLAGETFRDWWARRR